MTLNEAITEGMLVTIIGLIIVFSVLIILMFALMLMKSVFYKPQKSAQKEIVKTEMPVSEVRPASKQTDDTEIIAVITAALAASLNTSAKQLKIKSYRRIGVSSPAWNRAGVSEMINSRL